MEIYNYLASYYKETYGVRGSSRSDAHKRQELRNVCKQIASINKKSPIYKVKLSSDTQCYAIDIKELARELKSSLSSVMGNEQGYSELFDKKQIFSTNPNALSVSYVGRNISEDTEDSVDIEVSKLARPQINTGTYLSSSARNLSSQTYSFQVDMEQLSYEFEFYVSPSASNLSIQTHMADLINRADIGISAAVLEDGAGHSAIELTSNATGTPRGGGPLFRIHGGDEKNNRHLIQVLGIGEMRQSPANAEFKIDGQDSTSRSNHFTIDKKYEIELHPEAVDDGNITLAFHTDADSIASELKDFFSTYNNMVTFAKDNQVQPAGSKRLHQDIGSIAKHFSNELEPLGLNVQEDGTIKIDDNLLKAAIADDRPENNFSGMNSFTKALAVRTNHILLDPMHYVDKLLVCYPNPATSVRSSYSPYHTSYYSGLLFNGYC